MKKRAIAWLKGPGFIPGAIIAALVAAIIVFFLCRLLVSRPVLVIVDESGPWAAYFFVVHAVIITPLHGRDVQLGRAYKVSSALIGCAYLAHVILSLQR